MSSQDEIIRELQEMPRGLRQKTLELIMGCGGGGSDGKVCRNEASRVIMYDWFDSEQGELHTGKSVVVCDDEGHLAEELDVYDPEHNWIGLRLDPNVTNIRIVSVEEYLGVQNN